MIRYLFYRVQKQYNSQWCWTAVAASISRFYNGHSNWSQCRIVSYCFQDQSCCRIPTPLGCNKPYQLNVALNVTRNLRSYHDQILTFAQIVTEIDNYRIIGVRIRWNYTSGHFVAIHGYDSSIGVEFLSIGDPTYGTKAVRFDFFSNNYGSVGGRWSHTYLTQPNNIFGMITYSTTDKNLLRRAEKLIPSRLRGGSGISTNISNESFYSKHSPHNIYVVDFESVLNRREEVQLVGLRLIDSYRNDMIIAEFNLNDRTLNLQQVFYDTSYTKPYSETLKFVLGRYRVVGQTYELRIISQPELNIEAFWLHGLDSNDSDIFISLPQNTDSGEREIYSQQRFYEFLRRLAENVNLSDDDLSGN